MKNISFVIILLLVISSYSYGQPSQAKSIENNFSWMLGSWKRINGNPAKTATEVWKNSSSSKWSGMGVTTRATDTVFVEHLSLLVKDNEFYYVANISHNQSPIYFKISENDQNHFIAENPQHDFPKKISYMKMGNQLKATISGNGKSIDFIFEKIANTD